MVVAGRFAALAAPGVAFALVASGYIREGYADAALAAIPLALVGALFAPRDTRLWWAASGLGAALVTLLLALLVGLLGVSGAARDVLLFTIAGLALGASQLVFLRGLRGARGWPAWCALAGLALGLVVVATLRILTVGFSDSQAGENALRFVAGLVGGLAFGSIAGAGLDVTARSGRDISDEDADA